MKKLVYLLPLMAVLAACGNDPIPSGQTYHRTQLIEHFTGEDCGYCPMGMDYIYEEYAKNQDGIVWVSNHYGFGTDEYTISESKTIGKALAVSGAPSISLNREKYTLEGSSSRNYHPYYTATVLAKTASTATEFLELNGTYDASSRNLHVVAKGETSNKELTGVMLTLAVTESGTVGAQADYVSSWEGWSKFTHTHTVRVYATAAMGDEVAFKKQRFTVEYDIPINAKWNADNCELVGWMTATGTKYPVLNAAKQPVVAGTKGGEDIKHGGVEAKAVSDTYPESGKPVSDIVLSSASLKLASTGSPKVGVLMGSNDTIDCGKYDSYGTMFPYVELYLMLPDDATSLPVGTYEVASTGAVNTIVAGSRNDEKFELEGSLFNYLFTYQNKQYLGYQWMIASGTLTVTESGFSFEGASRNGSPIKFSYAAPAASGAPMRVAAPARNRAAYMLVDDAPAARLF